MKLKFRKLKWFLPCLLVLSSPAAQFVGTNSYMVAVDEVVADEQWVAANIALAEGLFENDLFISATQKLTLDGVNEGNVWGGSGGDVLLTGVCQRNVRLAGSSVRIDGSIEGNLMAIAETIVVTTNAMIGGNVRLIGTSIILEGSIDGAVSVLATRVATLGGTIRGDASVTAPDILFSRATQLLGGLAYTANKELFPDEGVVVGPLARVVPPASPLFSAEKLASRSMWFLAAVFAGIPFIAFFPMSTAMAAQQVKQAPLKCLWVGFLASGFFPLLGILCASALIGRPLGALILAAWGIMLYLGRIIMGLVLGTLLLRRPNTSFSRILLTLILGLAFIYFTALIPLIGFPIQMTVIWMGMGSLVLAMIQKRHLLIQPPKGLNNLKDENYKPEEK